MADTVTPTEPLRVETELLIQAEPCDSDRIRSEAREADQAEGAAWGSRPPAILSWFPVEELAPVAELESWRKEINRPTYHIHKWWANRLGSVFRAILLASLQPVGTASWDQFYKPTRLDSPIVLDPFMGSGTTLGEALKLSCRVVGCDINSIAALQVQKALDRTDPTELARAYDRVEARVADRIRRYYRTTSSWSGLGADALYTFWVMTGTCGECGATNRLFSRYVFAQHAYPRKSPKVQVLCPSCRQVFAGIYGREHETCPGCQRRFDPVGGPVSGGKLVCVSCGRSTPVAAAARAGGPPSYEMYATLILEPDGTKQYQATTAADRQLLAEACAELATSRELPLPELGIRPGHNTDQVLNYGITSWRHLFNPRQQVCLALLLDAVLREPDRSLRELLLVLFSGVLEFNNMLCSFKGEGTGAVRHAFAHHVLHPRLMPLEAHPWGTPASSGSFSTLFQSRLLRAKEYGRRPFEVRPTDGARREGEKVYLAGAQIAARMASSFADLQDGSADALVLCGDSARLPLPDASVDVVVTDPPYFDNVNYSELADFFYAWLQPVLQGEHPAFQAASTRHEREVQTQDAREFGQLLGDVFTECRRVLRPGGLVVFTFHHSKPEAWVGLALALRRAGLAVLAVHAIKAEMSVAAPKQATKEPIDIDCVVVAASATRVVGTSGPSGTGGREQRSDALAAAAAAAARLRQSGLQLSRTDVRVILAGQALPRLTETSLRDADVRAALAALWEQADRIEEGPRPPVVAASAVRAGSPVVQLDMFEDVEPAP